MKKIIISLFLLSVIASTSSYIFAEDERTIFVNTFMVKCKKEWDNIVIKQDKGNQEEIENELKLNEEMAGMVAGGVRAWFDAKLRWDAAKAARDFEEMKIEAEYCNDTRKLTMDVCPKQAKTLPVLKAK